MEAIRGTPWCKLCIQCQCLIPMMERTYEADEDWLACRLLCPFRSAVQRVPTKPCQRSLVRCTATSIRFNIERQNAFCSVLFICSLIASLLSGRRRSPNRDAPPGRQIISWHWAELH
eukprot:138580-Pyramimonas_sp.AAC.1